MNSQYHHATDHVNGDNDGGGGDDGDENQYDGDTNDDEMDLILRISFCHLDGDNDTSDVGEKCRQPDHTLVIVIVMIMVMMVIMAPAEMIVVIIITVVAMIMVTTISIQILIPFSTFFLLVRLLARGFLEKGCRVGSAHL